MFESRKVLAVIPARGGSKRLPRKNVLPFAGRPLVHWAVRSAIEAEIFDEIIVSSDDDEILRAGAQAGGDPHRRPPELADDTATSLDVVRHVLGIARPTDILVLLQPTSPLCLSEDIRGCLDLMVRANADSVVSVSDPPKCREWAHRLDHQMVLRAVPADDPGEPLVGPNGAVYASRVNWLLENAAFIADGTLGFVMPAFRSIDIDTREDFEEAERRFLLRKPDPSGFS